jgi:hypothetical protein
MAEPTKEGSQWMLEATEAIHVIPAPPTPAPASATLPMPPGLWRTGVWFLCSCSGAVAAFCVCLYVSHCTLMPQSLPCRPAGRWQDRCAVDRQGTRSVPLCLRMGTLID